MCPEKIGFQSFFFKISQKGGPPKVTKSLEIRPYALWDSLEIVFYTIDDVF